MLSPSFLMEEFTEKIKDMSYEEIIWTADREATEAERRFYRTRSNPDLQTEQLKNYAAALKNFIFYMRNDVKTAAMRNADWDRLERLRYQKTHTPSVLTDN